MKLLKVKLIHKLFTLAIVILPLSFTLSGQSLGITISKLFDGGLSPLYSIEGNTITFNSKGSPGELGRHINVFIDNTPDIINVEIIPTSSQLRHWKEQGLFVSNDGTKYLQVPFSFSDSTIFKLQLQTSGSIWLASCLPYGRNGLDQLFVDTHNTSSLSTYLIKKDNRIVPVFQFGEDDGKKLIHYFIAGECAWETAGQWVADYMVRELCVNDNLREKLTENYVIRIIPHLSPYSATMPAGSYTPVNGPEVYGAATWHDEFPPTEFAIIRNEIETLINEKRLGCMLTIHSWSALNSYSGIETIRSSGENRLEGSRYDSAKKTLETFVEDLPRSKWVFPENIWHKGLARDYLLNKHNAVTFRIEITTHNIDYHFLEEMGRRLLENTSKTEDWGYVLKHAELL